MLQELLTALYDYEKKPSAQQKEHKFWKTQPVPQHGEQPTDHGPIQVGVLDEVPKEGLALPKVRVSASVLLLLHCV